MMTRLQFGQFVNLLSHWGMRVLDTHEMNELEAFVDLPKASLGPYLNRPMVACSDVDELIKHMAAKTNKIDAIKAYRQITNAGLKEAKDAVERYW